MRHIVSMMAVLSLFARVSEAQGAVAHISSIPEQSGSSNASALGAAYRFPTSVADTTRRPTRRSTVTGAVAGAVIGGLATAGYVLNAHAYHCVYNLSSGAPCSKTKYVVIHTVTIAAGATAGAFIGVKIAHWISRRL